MTDLIKALAIKFNKIDKAISRHDQLEVDYISHEEFIALMNSRDEVEQQILQHMDTMDSMADIFKIYSLMWRD